MQSETDRLLTAEALFAEKMYAKSAAVFASTSLPVEDLFLRFLPLNQPAALKELLMAKLEQAADEDTTEVTLLTFWLMELMLQTMDETEGEQQDLLRAELRSLLCEPKIRKSLCPIRGKVYDLLSSFGDDDTLVFFAQETGDYAVLVDHYVKKKTFVYAIAVLQQCKQVDLVLQYAAVLFHQCPQQTISFLVTQSDVPPIRVLTCLMRALSHDNRPDLKQQVIRYLEHEVYNAKSKDKVLLNQLLVLYAENEPEKFHAFLNDRSTIHLSFDELYVLRVAEQLQMHVPCVKLLQRMGLFEDAVDKAVSVDMGLAKEVARDEQHEERFRKKLWLKIAEKVVADGASFTDFVRESETVAVPDLLPLLPDFRTIQLFKKAICSTLQDYSDHLDGLKEDMSEAADNLDEVKQDLKQWRKESVCVSSSSKCSTCHQNVFFTLFYAFRCQHLFHSKCLAPDPDECPLCGCNMIESIHVSLTPDSGTNSWP